MADSKGKVMKSKSKDTKSLTVREAYELHKVVGADEKRLAFISGYARGYYDKSVGNKMRWGDEDVLATTAGNDLRLDDSQSQDKGMNTSPTIPPTNKENK